MINSQELEKMYLTIADDLNIINFGGEPIDNFHNRIIYSALGKWILQLFSDRDFENSDINQVSKAHVTISALDVLSSYKKLDDSISQYFTNDRDLIYDLEKTYEILGYIISGNHVFKCPNYRNRVAFRKKTLVIDLESSAKKMRGLGIWGKFDEEKDMPLNEFYLNEANAITNFENVISRLNFTEFNSNINNYEVYDYEENKWNIIRSNTPFNYKYHIIRANNELNYQILLKDNGMIYSASLPLIYLKKFNDKYFINEIGRIILGLCAYNGHPVSCKISKYYDLGIKFTITGNLLPFFENSLLKCLAWPLDNANSNDVFVTDASMKPSLIMLLEHLSIKVIED